ncbi:hypothetical protein BB561_004410 [Smittium simulii]|uniref:CCHC-type domain-containing protein n=1 Tax=Smittium simulii TaxID=133385 RepID=A0A2T9YGG3_9FUNG|nr:hypothetical protein BB561_004410 [Smittium simulii]
MSINSKIKSGTCARNTGKAQVFDTAAPAMPKIPEFRGKPVGFPRWISWVSDLFTDYPQLTDFNRRMMVVDSLKEEARAWYDAEPDSSTTSWEALKNALLCQYGGTNSITNALQTISSMTLTRQSDFSNFIQRIRPAIQLVAKSDSTLSVAMLRQQVDSDIRRFIPEIQNKTYTSFEQRLRLQLQELQIKSDNRSNTVYRPTDLVTSMGLDTIAAPIRRFNSSSEPASYSAFRPRSPSGFNQRNTKPHTPNNSTMSPSQFKQYVKNCICFTCGKKGHLKTMCPNNNRQFRNFNVVETSDDTNNDQENDQA